MLIALLQPESQTVQESLGHDCHFLLQTLLLYCSLASISWKLDTFLPLFSFTNANTFTVVHPPVLFCLKLTAHSMFNYKQLKLKQSLLRRDMMALRILIALAYPCPKFLGLLPPCPQSSIPCELLEATSPWPRGVAAGTASSSIPIPVGSLSL